MIYEMTTLNKLFDIGCINEKDILNLQIEDLLKIDDIVNIIEIRKCIREKSLIELIRKLQVKNKKNIKKDITIINNELIEKDKNNNE